MKNRMFSVFYFLAFFLGYNTAESEPQINSESLKSRIETYLNKSVENGYSASVLVEVKGNIVLSEGFGWADREKRVPNTASSIFNIGSVTKQFTASAILKLFEQGKIKTSEKLSNFFPDAPDDKKGITIHQLLTHTSGISPATGGFRYDEAAKEQFISDFFESELLTLPGTKHRYANANYIMLAAIIELVSGQTYSAFLEENFWEPLQMNHTRYKQFTFSSGPIAHGYYFDVSAGEWEDWGITEQHLPHSENHWYSIGKGDINSTVEDLYKWHLALKSNKVLSAESQKLLETPFVPENEDNSSFYGYGWAIFSSNRGTKIVMHNGSNGIYFANFVRYVDDEVVVIVLSNVRMNYDSELVAWEIANMVFDPTYQPKPVTKLNYELVYDFFNSHGPDDAQKLIPFLETKLGGELNDKALFNRLGFKMIAKENKPAWGLELLKLNVLLFPDDGNLWDSLGEGYFLLHDKDNAVESFEKALELKTDENCYWCDNSTKRLQKLKE